MRSLDEIVVSASRFEREVIPVQELSGKQLDRLSAHSVADALRYFSGLQIKDYGGIGGLKTVNVRSLGSQHVGVFYEGIQLGNAQNGIVDLGRFSLDNMESVVLYNGQRSDIFQSAKDYASSSAIYLNPRKPKFEEGCRNHFNLGLKAGSFQTYNPSLLWEHRLSEHLSSSLSAEYMRTSGRYPFTYRKKDGYDTTQIRENGDVQALRMEAGLYGHTGKSDWSGKVYFYDSERGYPGAAVREDPGVFSHQDRQWDRNMFVQAGLKHYFNGKYALQAKAKYAYDYLRYLSDPRLDVSTMFVDNTYRQQEGYASLAHLFELFSWWKASVATDAQINTLDANLVNFAYPTRYTFLCSPATNLEWEGLKLQASLLFSHIDDQTQLGEAADILNRWTPTVVASWRPVSDIPWNLRAFYKHIFRMPTLNDLYYTFIGNKYLLPEYTRQYNIGNTYRLERPQSLFDLSEFQADVYFNQVENKIVAMPTGNQFRWTMINLGYVEIRGLDLAVQTHWQIRSLGESLRIAYTYQLAQDKTDASSPWYGGQIPYIPKHSGSAVYSADWGPWSWNYSFIYTGERYEAVANIPENYSLPWYTSDVSLSRCFLLESIRQSELNLTLEINNLFNQAYEVVKCYPMPGIHWRLKVNWIF